MVRTPTASRPVRPLTILAVVAMLVPMSGCIDSPDGDDVEMVTINLASPVIEPRNTGSEEVYDARLSINKITPRDSTVKWSDVEVLIKAADGSLLLPLTVPKEDTTIYTDVVEIWYDDTTGKRGEVDAGDALVISGMDDSEYEGGHVEVRWKDRLVADTRLPTDFS